MIGRAQRISVRDRLQPVGAERDTTAELVDTRLMPQDEHRFEQRKSPLDAEKAQRDERLPFARQLIGEADDLRIELPLSGEFTHDFGGGPEIGAEIPARLLGYRPRSDAAWPRPAQVPCKLKRAHRRRQNQQGVVVGTAERAQRRLARASTRERAQSPLYVS